MTAAPPPPTPKTPAVPPAPAGGTPHPPAPVDLAEESVAGEEDPGAALEDLLDKPPPAAPPKGAG